MIEAITIKQFGLIVGVDNQQTGIIQCRLVLFLGSKLNGVVGGKSHGRGSVDYLVIILPSAGGSETSVPPLELAHPASPAGTPDIASLPVPVPLFRVVDANTRNFQPVL